MRIGLAIATFRQDAAVMRLLERLHQDGADLFERIYVVDSMGSGAIEAHIQAMRYEGVVYENHAENLGSAGNWARRLQLAANDGLDWCFTVNHDGEIPAETIQEFIRCVDRLHGEGKSRVGALYPLRYVPHRSAYDFTGTQRFSLPFKGLSAPPTGELTGVYWGSSNGSFYNLQAVREGLLPWADLWMGWEDLGYGWLLHQAGWEQFIVHSAPLTDDREYLDLKAPGVNFTSSDKPAWYAYYSARNWMLVTRRNRRPLLEYGVIAARLGVETLVTLGFKESSATRLRYMAKGLQDGLRGQTGKWIVP